MPFLWLLSSKDSRYIAVIVILGGMLMVAGHKIVAQRDLILAKPKIEVQFRDRTVTKLVRGPERIITKTVIAPDGTKTITKEDDRSESVKTSDDTRVGQRTETPAIQLISPKLWTLTGSLNPFDVRNPNLGLSRSFGFMTIGYSHDVGPIMARQNMKDGHHINLGIPLF